MSDKVYQIKPGVLTKTTVIIFTYNRALQLDALLSSLFVHYRNLDLPIHIIYHWSQTHEESYNRLRKTWEKKGVVFHLRSHTYPRKKMLRLLLRPINLYWYFKSAWLRNSFDNFKFLLEDIISSCKSDFITFSTDDQIMFKDTIVPETAFSLIKTDPKSYSYRFISGVHFKDENGIPENMHVHYYEEGGKPVFFGWRNSDEHATEVWKYRFHVDGTIYEKNTLNKLLKPLIYHMPTTLEGGGLWESRLRGYFDKGLSAMERTFVGIQANNIQAVSDTPSANFDVTVLMKAYLQGYCLEVHAEDVDQYKYIYIPKELYLKRGPEVISYTEFCRISD